MATVAEIADGRAITTVGRAFLEGAEAVQAFNRQDYDRTTHLLKRYGLSLQDFIDVLKPPARPVRTAADREDDRGEGAM